MICLFSSIKEIFTGQPLIPFQRGACKARKSVIVVPCTCLSDSNKNEIITILVCMFTHGYPDAPLNSSNRQFPLLFSSLCPIAPVKIAVAYGFGYMVALDMFTGFQVGNGTGNL